MGDRWRSGKAHEMTYSSGMSNTRVGILTLPLSDNFGGLIQAVSLYKAIEEAGFQPVFIDKDNNRSPLKQIAATFFQRFPGQNVNGHRGRYLATQKHRAFLEEAMPFRTKKVRNSKEISNQLIEHGINTVVIGSDQVWRFEYQGDGGELNYFGSFGPDNLKRVSYAASFGHSEWKYPEKTDAVAKAISKFSHVTVREYSGIEICDKHFHRPDAVKVVDPTLLMDPSFFHRIAKRRESGGVLIYVLDHKNEATKIAGMISDRHYMMSPYEGDFVSIPEWIGNIASADFIVTDSYHGTLFSIIFEKQFFTIANKDRGFDRFKSILYDLNLEDRIINNFDIDITKLDHIDYNMIKNKLKNIREYSKEILKDIFRQ